MTKRNLYTLLLLLSIGMMIVAFIEGEYLAALPATYGVLTSAKELLDESETDKANTENDNV